MKSFRTSAWSLVVVLGILAPSCAWVGAAARGGKARTTVTVPAAQQGAFEVQIVEASVDRYSESAIRALEAHDWAKAATAFESALLTAPDSASSHFGLGIALEMTGKVDEALGHYERAIKFGGANPEYKLAIERAHAKLGR